jgi:hypothetical protein
MRRYNIISDVSNKKAFSKSRFYKLKNTKNIAKLVLLKESILNRQKFLLRVLKTNLPFKYKYKKRRKVQQKIIKRLVKFRYFFK